MTTYFSSEYDLAVTSSLYGLLSSHVRLLSYLLVTLKYTIRIACMYVVCVHVCIQVLIKKCKRNVGMAVPKTTIIHVWQCASKTDHNKTTQVTPSLHHCYDLSCLHTAIHV